MAVFQGQLLLFGVPPVAVHDKTNVFWSWASEDNQNEDILEKVKDDPGKGNDADNVRDLLKNGEIDHREFETGNMVNGKRKKKKKKKYKKKRKDLGEWGVYILEPVRGCTLGCKNAQLGRAASGREPRNHSNRQSFFHKTDENHKFN